MHQQWTWYHRPFFNLIYHLPTTEQYSVYNTPSPQQGRTTCLITKQCYDLRMSHPITTLPDILHLLVFFLGSSEVIFTAITSPNPISATAPSPPISLIKADGFSMPNYMEI
jgi:hypothetical protein